jgi:transcriptional antiterminator RfaH
MTLRTPLARLPHQAAVRKEIRRAAGAEEFEHYLPLVTSVRRYAQQTKRFTKPLFPGYVFARCRSSTRRASTSRTCSPARSSSRTRPSSSASLPDVKAIVASGFELSVMPLLTKGRRVKVIGGPLHGLEGFVDDPSNPRGIVLSVDVLQQGLLVKMPPCDSHP